MPANSGIEAFYEAILKYEWVSFDVFDTLLMRPYVEPTDLFRHIELSERADGFANARIKAERDARRKLFPEVTLEEIYSFMPHEFSTMADLEMEYESRALTVNPEMKNVFDTAIESCKNIIFLSDMYLPSDFIQNVLEKNGYIGHLKLYVSCDYRESKHDGRLFLRPLEDFSLQPGELLHIGDNRKSDYLSPKRLGIKAMRRERPVDRYFRCNARERRYYKCRKNLQRSIVVGLDTIGWANEYYGLGFWEKLGFRYGGPILAGFASFIDENVSDDGTLLFIARDGFGPMRAYNIIFGKNKNRYVYAPRIFTILFGLNGRDYPGYEEQIVSYFSDMGALECDNEVTAQVNFKQKSKLIAKCMEKELKRFSEYLETNISGKGTVFVVDASTMKFSSQRLIDTALSHRDVVGIYYNLMADGSQWKNKSFRRRSRLTIGFSDVDLPEYFMSSTEPPVVGISPEGKPIYSNSVHKDEMYKMETLEQAIAGEDLYLELFKKVLGGKNPAFESDSLSSWVDSFSRNMVSEEIEHLKNLRWASDPSHEDFHGIVFSPRDFFDYLMQKISYGISSIKQRIRK